MEIEYDENKQAETLQERGLDFKDALIVFSSGRTIAWTDNRHDL
jgi:uncharacterized DUF497 family protein